MLVIIKTSKNFQKISQKFSQKFSAEAKRFLLGFSSKLAKGVWFGRERIRYSDQPVYLPWMFWLRSNRPVCLIPFGHLIHGSWVTTNHDSSPGKSPILPDLLIQPSTLTQNTQLKSRNNFYPHRDSNSAPST